MILKPVMWFWSILLTISLLASMILLLVFAALFIDNLAESCPNIEQLCMMNNPAAPSFFNGGSYMQYQDFRCVLGDIRNKLWWDITLCASLWHFSGFYARSQAEITLLLLHVCYSFVVSDIISQCFNLNHWILSFYSLFSDNYKRKRWKRPYSRT